MNNKITAGGSVSSALFPEKLEQKNRLLSMSYLEHG